MRDPKRIKRVLSALERVKCPPVVPEDCPFFGSRGGRLFLVRPSWAVDDGDGDELWVDESYKWDDVYSFVAAAAGFWSHKIGEHELGRAWRLWYEDCVAFHEGLGG